MATEKGAWPRLSAAQDLLALGADFTGPILARLAGVALATLRLAKWYAKA